MSAAAADETEDIEEAVPVKKGRKKLLLLLAAGLLVVAAAGAAATVVIKKRAAAAAEAAESGETVEAPAAEPVRAALPKPDPKYVPTFVPLDPFTVNLADRDADRYAQVGVTLELENGKSVDRIKAFMPAIRNNVLLVLADKTAAQLLDAPGKARLAAEIRRAAVKPLGFEVHLPDEAAPGAARTRQVVQDDDDAPVRAVHFSNFIIQ